MVNRQSHFLEVGEWASEVNEACDGANAIYSNILLKGDLMLANVGSFALCCEGGEGTRVFKLTLKQSEVGAWSAQIEVQGNLAFIGELGYKLDLLVTSILESCTSVPVFAVLTMFNGSLHVIEKTSEFGVAINVVGTTHIQVTIEAHLTLASDVERTLGEDPREVATMFKLGMQRSE